jgi:hypothetical protein
MHAAVKRVLIPYAARVAGIYYGIRHGGAMQEAILRMANS